VSSVPSVVNDSHGCPPPSPEDLFCALCGRPTGEVSWALSREREASEAAPGELRVRPGGSFFVRFANSGVAPVRVEADLTGARGVTLEGAAQRRVAPGQSGAFELVHAGGEPPVQIGGTLLLRSEDGPRQEWWERRSWREQAVRLSPLVQVRGERWVWGAPALLFPSGVRAQVARVWNDSDQPRALSVAVPSGYRVSTASGPIDHRPLPVPAGESLGLLLQVASVAGSSPDTEWLTPAGERVPIVRMEAPPAEAGDDLVIAIDFGTRNTSIRARWRRTLLPSKPAGTVDVIGDAIGSARFPTQMVLDVHERTFRWGTDAARYIAQNRMTADEVPAENVKTYLREGEEGFTKIKPEWTNEGLVRRFFERIVHRVDLYLKSADPAHPLTREGIAVRWVLCRPVLDANEGDERGRRYEAALRGALVRCGVPEERIRFVQEPVAAAIGIAKSRQDELLSLPPGAAIAVIDSGGGTTDVAVARPRMTGGKLDLELLGSYAVERDAENPATRLLGALGIRDRLQIGGNVLDWSLAHRLLSRASEVLESDAGRVPESLLEGLLKNPLGPAMREFVRITRQMKERFARVSTQYLNRPPGEARPEGEVLPFPTRSDLQGVYLLHDLYDRNVVAPILRPAVHALASRMAAAAHGVRPEEVRRVFYVGGTNVDPFVRQHFGRLFPLSPDENDAQSQSDERISERLCAVVDGAVWLDERLFPPSPLTIVARIAGAEVRLVDEGAALPPEKVAAPRFHTLTLAPGEELDAQLVSQDGGLAQPMTVARGFHRNESDRPREVSLVMTVSREKGAVAHLQDGDARTPLWRLILAEEP
jgi:hypothetical protein